MDPRVPWKRYEEQQPEQSREIVCIAANADGLPSDCFYAHGLWLGEGGDWWAAALPVDQWAYISEIEEAIKED